MIQWKIKIKPLHIRLERSGYKSRKQGNGASEPIKREKEKLYIKGLKYK